MRKEEGRNWWSIIGTLFIVLIFVGSTIGFIFAGSKQDNEEENLYEYGEYSFTRTDSGWQTETAFGPLVTINWPEQVKNVECDCPYLTYSSLLAQKVYVIAFSEGERNAAGEILRNVPFANVQEACLPKDADKEGCENLPLKGCEDATSEVKVLIFSEDDLTERASFNNNCLRIQGKDLLKAADKVIYKAFGIE